MGDHVLHLAAIGAGVHIGCATHRAGNAAGKFQTAESMVRCRIAQLLQRGASLCRKCHTPVGQGNGVGNLAKELSQLENQAPYTAIPYEQIAAIPQDAYLRTGISGGCICRGKLLNGSNLHQYIRRSSQSKGGIAAHGRVFKNLLFGYRMLQCFQ